MSAHGTKGSGMTWVGRAIRRLEDPALVTGQGRFTADLPAAHWVRFVRSPVAAGKITKIDAPKGAMVVTAADLKGVKKITPMLHKFNYKPVGQPILADGVVRFVGEPVAAVVAASEEDAEDIADLVEVVDRRDHAGDRRARGAQAGAPQVHAEAPGNVILEGKFKTPDFDAAWSGAHKIVKVEARSRRQNATPMEARAGHAAYDASTGRVTLTCTTQMPHLTRTAIADVLGMPESDLRVIAPDVGGGFGQKMSLGAEYVVLVWLARKLKSSVAWTEDRRENLIAGFHARDQYITLEGAFDKNAKLIALNADIAANIGAYSCFPTTCGVEPLMAMAEMPGPLRRAAIPVPGARRHHQHLHHGALSRRVAAGDHLHVRAIDGQGGGRVRHRPGRYPPPQPDRQVSLHLGDGPGVRRGHLQADAGDGGEGHRRAGVPRAAESRRAPKAAISASALRPSPSAPAMAARPFAARGMEITPGWETVILTVDPSGFVEARIGSSPHGQGLRTTLAQIIADEIGVTPDVIKVVHGDTDTAPYGWGTFASRSLVISGGATLIAAQKVRAKLIKIASHMLEAAPGDIVLEDGAAKVAGTDRSVTIAKMAREAYTQTHRFKGEIEPGLTETGTYDPPGTFSNACHVAIVEVDVETGHVKVEKFLVAEDAGRIINPMIADGQVHGGIAQGIGNALLEEIIYDESGGILTANLADYMPPTAHEIPEIELHHMETPSTTSITKAKGLGEGGAIGAPAAIVNAINDALSPFGVQIDEIPATPQRIREALRNAETAAKKTA